MPHRIRYRSKISLFSVLMGLGTWGCASDIGDDPIDSSTEQESTESGTRSNAAQLSARLDPELILNRYPDAEHTSTVQVGTTVFTLLKLNGTQGLREVALDAQGNEVSSERVHEAYLAQYRKYGTIHPTLAALMSVAGGPIEVLAELAFATPPTLPKPPDVSTSIESVLADLEQRHLKNLEQLRGVKAEILKRLGLSSTELVRDAEGSPFVVLSLTPGRIKELSQNPLVLLLLAHDARGIEDLAAAMSIANADDVQAAGVTGAGVKVAVFEGCPDDVSQLVISGSYSSTYGLGCSASSHARHVTGIIRNTNAVPGFAPGARIYSADSTNLAAFDWAVDSIRVSTLNQSFHRAAEIGNGLQADDLYKDYKVLHYPWPMIVHAAGNWCSPGSPCFEGGTSALDEFVNHKGFNTISVGNHNDTAVQMSASSCFVNPTSPHSDRELPEIAANGTNVDAVGLNLSGTSMSSPATTGSVALLQSAQTVLKIWPEGVRALLFAGSTRNVATHPGTTPGGAPVANAPSTWWKDVAANHDAFDGAGALDIGEAVEIAKYRYNGTAKARGWDIGTMSGGSFNTQNYFNKTYRFKVPSFASSAKIALAWNSTATVSGVSAAEIYASALQMDLDIRVFDSTGAQVAFSLSWDNSYEIVDFKPKLGETYTIKVHRWSTKPGAWTWFGIAWAAR